MKVKPRSRAGAEITITSRRSSAMAGAARKQHRAKITHRRIAGERCFASLSMTGLVWPLRRHPDPERSEGEGSLAARSRPAACSGRLRSGDRLQEVEEGRHGDEVDDRR